jgi:hypothetical protein
MATTARRPRRDRARLRGFVRSLTRAAACWRDLDLAYMADLEREARVYLVLMAQPERPLLALPPPTSVTFPQRSPKKGIR